MNGMNAMAKAAGDAIAWCRVMNWTVAVSGNPEALATGVGAGLVCSDFLNTPKAKIAHSFNV